MELQWPLIIFTALVAWSAGLFGTRALMAVFGVGKKAQVPAGFSAILLAAGRMWCSSTWSTGSGSSTGSGT